MLRVGFSPATPKTRRTIRSTRVRATATGVVLDDERTIPGEAIGHPYYQARRGETPSVRCVGRDGEVLFETEVESEREATRFLRALGHDVSPRRLHYSVNSPLSATPIRRLFGGVTLVLVTLLTMRITAAIGLGGGTVAMLLAVLPGFVGLGLLGVPRALEVGADGLLLRWLWSRRFIRHDEIRAVEATNDGLELVLTNGRRLPLGSEPSSPQAPRGSGRHGKEVRQAALRARILKAREAHQRSKEDVTTLATRIARGGRPVAEWRADLSKLRASDGYRAVLTRDDDLWQVVEDSSAPEDARAGAALALRSSEEAAPRLRIAAETVASPRLRVALERAADPDADERALDDALASFEAEEQKQSA